ncbi:hypothetical protein ACFQ5D_18165 [Paenibacillus farraposensis]|uniref:Uncharacterized protein n=1 Tax=Paenibacillus farraposensis TaxID=2807095 RepID=A0ABW4DHG4_9BACL|nr:hypothetical protein [Paenibacillus farraposensis]MCC3381956.1 hypothetical protein [Paenibacillus farraposensis]
MSKYFLCKYDSIFFLEEKGGDITSRLCWLYFRRTCGDDGGDDDVSDDGDIFLQKSLHEKNDHV